MPHYQLDPLIAEALEGIQDGFLILAPDGEPIISNAPVRRHFGTFYAALNAGAGFEEAIIASLKVNMPEASQAELAHAAKAFIEGYNQSRPYETITEEGRRVRVSYWPLSEGRRVAISVDVTELRDRE